MRAKLRFVRETKTLKERYRSSRTSDTPCLHEEKALLAVPWPSSVIDCDPGRIFTKIALSQHNDMHLSDATKPYKSLFSPWLDDTDEVMVNRTIVSQTTPRSTSESPDSDTKSQSPIDYLDIKTDSASDPTFFPKIKQEYIRQNSLVFRKHFSSLLSYNSGRFAHSSAIIQREVISSIVSKCAEYWTRVLEAEQIWRLLSRENKDGHDEKRRCTSQTSAKGCSR
jgi:hypothetical protein